jgi:DNA-binding transcriptional regulator YhcF (GntR family)
MDSNQLENTQILSLTNKTNQDKRIGKMRELLKDHIDKYKQMGMSEEDIDDYLKLYL